MQFGTNEKCLNALLSFCFKIRCKLLFFLKCLETAIDLAIIYMLLIIIEMQENHPKENLLQQQYTTIKINKAICANGNVLHAKHNEIVFF